MTRRLRKIAYGYALTAVLAVVSAVVGYAQVTQQQQQQQQEQPESGSKPGQGVYRPSKADAKSGGYGVPEGGRLGNEGGQTAREIWSAMGVDSYDKIVCSEDCTCTTGYVASFRVFYTYKQDRGTGTQQFRSFIKGCKTERAALDLAVADRLVLTHDAMVTFWLTSKYNEPNLLPGGLTIAYRQIGFADGEEF